MKPTRWFRVLVRWHRWVGLTATLLIVWLAVTGVLIHHAPDFGLGNEPGQALRHQAQPVAHGRRVGEGGLDRSIRYGLRQLGPDAGRQGFMFLRAGQGGTRRQPQRQNQNPHRPSVHALTRSSICFAASACASLVAAASRRP